MKYIFLIYGFLTCASSYAANCTVVDVRTKATIQQFGESTEHVDFVFGGKEISVAFIDHSQEEFRYMINATMNYGTESEVQIDSLSKNLPMKMNLTFGEDIAHWLVIDCR